MKLSLRLGLTVSEIASLAGRLPLPEAEARKLEKFNLYSRLDKSMDMLFQVGRATDISCRVASTTQTLNPQPPSLESQRPRRPQLGQTPPTKASSEGDSMPQGSGFGV